MFDGDRSDRVCIVSNRLRRTVTILFGQRRLGLVSSPPPNLNQRKPSGGLEAYKDHVSTGNARGDGGAGKAPGGGIPGSREGRRRTWVCHWHGKSWKLEALVRRSGACLR